MFIGSALIGELKNKKTLMSISSVLIFMIDFQGDF